MGLISVLTGLGARKETYNFTGKIRDNLNLRWDYAKLFKGGEEITPEYFVGEDDIILIQEYPGGSTGTVLGDIVVGVLTLGVVPIVNAVTDYNKNMKQLDEALSRMNAKTNAKETGTIPFISGAKNASAEGQAAPILLGRHGFAPYFISNPYLKISGTDGERLDWHGTFLVAQKDVCFEKISLGTQVIKSFSGSGATESAAYPFDPGYFYDAENLIEIRQGGLFSEPIFDQKWVDSLQSQIALDYPIVDDEETGGKKWDDSKVIVRQSAKNPCVVEIELTLEGLFAWDSANGTPVDASAEVYIGWSTDKENYRQIPIEQFDSNDAAGSLNVEGTGRDIPQHSKLTRAKNKQMRFVARLDINEHKSYIPEALGYGEVSIKAMRCNPDGSGSTRDKVYITAIRTQIYSSASTVSELIPAKNMDARIRGKFCRMGIRIKADDRTKEGLDAFNVVASMTGRTWDGFGWSASKSAVQNSAAVALETLTGLVHDASKFADDQVDLNSFGAVFDFCESQQITLGSGETKTVALQANGYVTKTAKKADILKQILATCEGGLYINEFGKLILYADWPQSIPVALLNPQRIVKMTTSKNFARKADGNKVEYINQDADFSVDTYRILRKGKSEADADALEHTYAPVQFYLVTQYLQAAWLARRMQAKEILRPVETKITVGKEGRHYPVNSLVKVQHERFRIGIGSGEISALIYEGGKLAGFRTLERFDLAADNEYIVEYQATTPERNRVVKKQIVSSGDYADVLLFVSPEEPDSLDIPEIGNIVSVSLRSYESALYLVGAGATETDTGFELPLINYDPDIYDSGPIPDYRSRLVTEQPKVYDTFERDIYEGLPGAAGNGVSGHSYKHRVTATSAVPEEGWSDSGWLTEIPTMSAEHKYLWRIERILYTNGDVQDMTTLSAVYGDTGPAGSNGAPATAHMLVASATSILRHYDGVMDPPVISCEQYAQTGGGDSVPSDQTLKYITATNGPEHDYTGPVTVGGNWSFIEFRLYEKDKPIDANTVPLDRETVRVVAEAPPAIRYELVTSVAMIIKDPAGAAIPSAITCSQRVTVGNKAPETSNKAIKYITSASPVEVVYSGSAIPVAWDWIEFRLYDGDALLDQERVFVLSEGEPAQTYEVQPSASVIKTYDGVTEPYKISCAQVSITGNGLPVPSNKTLKYATSLSDEQPYEGEIIVSPAWQWIEFRLYDGDVLLDKERVPVLADGVAPIYLDLANQNISVRADEYGEPYSLPITTQAVLYNGNIPITAADFKANLAAKNIVHYPGNIFDPMLGGLYPVRAVQWGISQGTIDQNGIITVGALPEDKAEIVVSALYDDAEYTATLTLNKIKDGESPVVIDIENENTSISCDSYGVPYPGELPLVTKAIFFKGTKPESPFWFLNTAISGVSIAQDGTLTVAAGAGLGRANNVLVCAAYRGKTYTRMFTVAKALEGFTATVYRLTPGANVIRRHADGSNEPAAISCAQEKIVGNNDPVPSDKTLVYITSESPAPTPYAGPVTVGNINWIRFLLYERDDFTDGDTPLDSERIPVLLDGEGNIVIDLDNENASIPCDAYGVPYPGVLPITIHASLYDGHTLKDPVWSLLNAPDGATIAADGTIVIANNIALSVLNNIQVQALYQGAAYTHMLTLGTTRDGESPVTLHLLPDNEVVQCDYLGNPTQGLPFTAQAILKEGDDEITAAMELADAAKVEIIRYPGNIFDPMLDGFYPTLGYPVAWSLVNAPAGVTIDSRGLVTASATAQLDDTNKIAIRAVYHGKEHYAILGVIKVRGGRPAVPSHTWIKFSDYADGTGLYDTPTAYTLYIGIAANKVSPIESNNKTDYVWSLFKGADGVPGAPGADGQTLYTWIRYADNAQGAGMSNDPTGKEYIGFAYNKPTATESDNPADYTWGLFKGEDGADGIPGPPGADGQTLYTWMRFADNAQGGGMSNYSEGKAYIGLAYNKPVAVESDDPASYQWTLIKGIDGTDGVPGPPGANGQSLYTWMRFADNAQGGGMSNYSEGKAYIGFAYNKPTATESNNPADYVWGRFKGDNANAPDSRGVTYTADTGNTGKVVISGVPMTMNDLDWVLFMGTTDHWTKARLYQWHEKERAWTMLAPADNPLQYMEALKDITREDAPDGIFSNVFCQVLFAQQATITALETTLLKVQNAIFGGERFYKFLGHVIDQGPDKPGFMLGANGVLKASNAEISGTVNATDGVFNGTVNATSGRFANVEILENSLFQGNITSGPLVLSNDSPVGTTYTLNSGSSAKTIRSKIVQGAGQSLDSGTYPVIGSYAGKQLVQIGYVYDYKSPNGNRFKLSIYAYYSDGTNNKIAYLEEYDKDVVENDAISSTLTFAFTTSGKTFKLINLPETPIAANVVYKDGNGFLKIG